MTHREWTRRACGKADHRFLSGAKGTEPSPLPGRVCASGPRRPWPLCPWTLNGWLKEGGGLWWRQLVFRAGCRLSRQTRQHVHLGYGAFNGRAGEFIGNVDEVFARHDELGPGSVLRIQNLRPPEPPRLGPGSGEKLESMYRRGGIMVEEGSTSDAVLSTSRPGRRPSPPAARRISTRRT